MKGTWKDICDIVYELPLPPPINNWLGALAYKITWPLDKSLQNMQRWIECAGYFFFIFFSVAAVWLFVIFQLICTCISTILLYQGSPCHIIPKSGIPMSHNLQLSYRSDFLGCFYWSWNWKFIMKLYLHFRL